MPIRFVSRGSRDQISGGFLYNKYVMAHLRQCGAEVVYHADPGDLADIGAGDLAIVDSLVVEETAAALLPVAAKLVLLLHMVPQCRKRRTALQSLCRRARLVVTGDSTLPLLRDMLATAELEAIKIEPGVPRHWQIKTRYARTAHSLLALSNYVRGKGLRRAIRLLAQHTDVPWTLRIHGNRDLDPAYYAAVIEQTRRCGLADRVELLGPLPHEAVNTSMLNSDLLLNFSRHESYSMVTAEAIACGLPVFANRTGNAAQFEQSGLVRYFDDDDARTHAALRQLLEDESAYGALRLRGVIGRRTWQDVGQEFVERLGLVG